MFSKESVFIKIKYFYIISMLKLKRNNPQAIKDESLSTGRNRELQNKSHLDGIYLFRNCLLLKMNSTKPSQNTTTNLSKLFYTSLDIF